MTVRIRPLTDADVGPAEDICRLAFGTFFGLPDPMTFRGDGALVAPRFAIDPASALVAETDAGLVGSGFVMNWGSVGILGPLSVHPDYWSGGIGRALTGALVDLLDRRGHDFLGLLTHPQSPRHVRLYESFGFEVQRLISVLRRETPAAQPMPDGAALLSEAAAGPARDGRIAACREIAGTVYRGLDHSREIAAAVDRGLGDTVLLSDGDRLEGYAVCHHGAGSEGSTDQLFVKAGAVRRGGDAAAAFARLLEACEALAATRGAGTIAAGTNTGRRGAYRILRERGYRSFMNAVAMLRPAGEGYGVPDAYAIDDWR